MACHSGGRICSADAVQSGLQFVVLLGTTIASRKQCTNSGDSFYHYKEYRYCLSVNVVTFSYAGFQACNLAYQLVTGKHIIIHPLHYHFDFFMVQVLAYPLILASSAAATRIDNWKSNWGKDEFMEMANASIGLSFLALFCVPTHMVDQEMCVHEYARFPG